MGEIARWSTTAANNTFSSPFGAQGSYPVSTVDNFERQIMSSLKEAYEDGEWLDYNNTYIPAFVNTTTFTIPADVTTLMTPYRKIKLYGSSFGTHCGVILSSSFSSPNTTIVVRMDEGVNLTSNISYLLVGISPSTVPSVTHDPSGATIPYLFGGNALSTWVSSPRNLIIGGNLGVNPWQRGVSFPAIANNAYCADMFSWRNTTGGVVTISQDTSLVPSPLLTGVYSSGSLKALVTTADTSISAAEVAGIIYRIEGYDFQQLHNQLWTLDFMVYATVAGTHCVAFRNGALDQSYIATFTVNTTNTWERKRISILAPSLSGSWGLGNATGLEIVFVMACGSNFQTTANTWQAGNFYGTSAQVNDLGNVNNIYAINLISIVKGFSTFDWNDDKVEACWANCDRYFFKTYPQSVAPGTPSTVAGAIQGAGTSASFPCVINVPLRTRMATNAPTATIFAPITGASGNMSAVSGGGNVASSVSINSSSNLVLSTVSTVAAGVAIYTHLTLDASL